MSEPGAIATGFFSPPIKIRQFVTLFVKHVVAGFPDALFVPQVLPAAFVGPRRVVVRPEPILTKLSRGMGFQRDQGILWPFRPNTDYNVDMVCTDVDSEKRPIAFNAKVSDCFLDGFSTLGVQSDRGMKQQFLTVLSPVAVCRNSLRSVFVVMPINARHHEATCRRHGT